jgi:hypothetical protein
MSSQERWNQHLEIQKALKKSPRDSTLNSLVENKFVQIHQKLGTGVYGTVFDASLSSISSSQNHAMPSLAIKFVIAEDNQSNRKYIISRLLREEVAYAYLNGLVFLQICPHFSLVHKSFITTTTRTTSSSSSSSLINESSSSSKWKENEDDFYTSYGINSPSYYHYPKPESATFTTTAAPEDLPMPYSIIAAPSTQKNKNKMKKKTRRDEYQFLICMERASGNAKQYFDHCGAAIASSIPIFICQLLLGIYSYTKHFDIVHNDLYLKNILFHELPSPMDFVYHFDDNTVIVLSSCSVFFSIGDFGICSSPSFLENSHQEMADLTTESRNLSSFLTFDFSKHILEYKNVNPYCRDIATLFRSILNMKESIPMNWRSYLSNSLKLLLSIQNGKDLCFFIRQITSPSFLIKNAIKSSIFYRNNHNTSSSSNGSSSSREEQHFYLDGTNHSDSASSLRFIACDYLKSIKSPY